MKVQSEYRGVPIGNASVSVPSNIFLNSLCKHSVGKNKGEVKNDHTLDSGGALY